MTGIFRWDDGVVASCSTQLWQLWMSADKNLENVPGYLAAAAVVVTAVSVTGFEILMGLALIATVLTRKRWWIPPVWLPVVVFTTGTLVSLGASGHVRDGMPQVKKFFVYLMLFLVAATFRTMRQIWQVTAAWSMAIAFSAVRGLWQFTEKYELASHGHQPFYAFYVERRITGFTSHWMTFSAEMMIGLLLVGSLICFSTDRRWTGWWGAAVVLLALALGAAWTRSVWLGTFCGGVYLIWNWKRSALMILPVVTGLMLWIIPWISGSGHFRRFHRKPTWTPMRIGSSCGRLAGG